tara:strand:+ start:464 stop:1327 length:864 start_codon:yes stop_codon:yes gene_type:complete
MKPAKKFNEKDVIDANRRYYNNNAKTYDNIVITNNSFTRLKKIISKILLTLNNNNLIDDDFIALDACGGTGNVSFIMNKMGHNVHLVDLSSSMIENFNKYCEKNKFSIKYFNSEINQYLISCTTKYNLIVFSSALHHLRYPNEVLINASKCLKPGGIILTIADPTLNVQRATFKIFSFFDRGINLIFRNPLELLKRLKKKIYKDKNNGKDGYMDWIAEYHAQKGIDDNALKTELTEKKLFILWHGRYTGGYNRLFQSFYKLIRMDTSFAMLISNNKYRDIKFDINLK